jgi:hypothetical protein
MRMREERRQIREHETLRSLSDALVRWTERQAIRSEALPGQELLPAASPADRSRHLH